MKIIGLILTYNCEPMIQKAINNIPKNEATIWVVCYEPLVGFDCTLPNNKEENWSLMSTEKNYLLKSRLFKIN